MPKPLRRRRAHKSNQETLLDAARASAQRLYGKLVTGDNPAITALLADLDRGDGKRTEFERVAETLGVRTGLAILIPRPPNSPAF